MKCIGKIYVVVMQSSNIKDALKEMKELSSYAKLPVSTIFNGVELTVNETTDLTCLEKEYELAILDHNSYNS